MRLILVDLPVAEADRTSIRLGLSRPIWDLRCGMTSLGQKLVAKTARRRRGLLRAALHGRGLPGPDRLAGQRPQHAATATTCSWFPAG